MPSLTARAFEVMRPNTSYSANDLAAMLNSDPDATGFILRQMHSQGLVEEVEGSRFKAAEEVPNQTKPVTVRKVTRVDV